MCTALNASGQVAGLEARAGLLATSGRARLDHLLNVVTVIQSEGRTRAVASKQTQIDLCHVQRVFFEEYAVGLELVRAAIAACLCSYSSSAPDNEADPASDAGFNLVENLSLSRSRRCARRFGRLRATVRP